MRTKAILLILVLILSFSFLSCENKDKKVAILNLDAGPGVPENIASLARQNILDYAAKRKNIHVISTILIDQQIAETGATNMADLIRVSLLFEADIIAVGTIKLADKDIDLIDNIRGNTAWYDIEVSFLDVTNGTVIASFNGTYDEKLSKMNNDLKKTKLGGGWFRWWWWIIIGFIVLCGIGAMFNE